MIEFKKVKCLLIRFSAAAPDFVWDTEGSSDTPSVYLIFYRLVNVPMILKGESPLLQIILY